LQAERDKIRIQIGKGTLDWIIKKEEAGNRVPFEASSKTTYAGVTKPVTLVAKLDPEGDTTVFDEKSMDKLFKSNNQWPTLQHFSKKKNQARLVFNNEADAKKAEKILKEDPKLTETVKSISEHKLNYPVVALATGTDKLEELQAEIEYRNEALKGNISSIKILSREKGHLQIYVTSKEAQMAILKVDIIHTNINGFKRHSVRAMDLNRKIRTCYRCHCLGHISSNCNSGSEVCGKCAEKTHRTSECVHLDSKFKCVNCKNGKHKSDDPKCPERVKAVERLKKLLSYGRGW
jgi:hypothetical protein